jgi:hypothetical protein
MSNPANATTTQRARSSAPVGLERNEWHQYRWNGGAWKPGSTTILRLQDAVRSSDSLMEWAVNLAIREFSRLTSMGMSFDDALPLALAETRKARETGGAVHEGVDKLLRNIDHVPPPSTYPFWYGLASFLLRDSPHVLYSEQYVANLTAGYGGTFDIGAEIRGELSLIDTKTGSVKPTHALQLASYDACEFMGAPGDPKKHPMPKFTAFYVLSLKADGYELVPINVTQGDRDHFLYLVQAFHRIKAWKSTPVTEPQELVLLPEAAA